MHITKVYINNFKGYRNFELKPDITLNLITGTNNSGKTTILEAISLWYECFKLLIMKSHRSDNRLHINYGDYRLGKKLGNYIDYRSISSVRSYSYGDIFFESNSSVEITIGITLKDNNSTTHDIVFSINSASGSNYEIHLKDHDNFDFQWFNTAFYKFPDPIGCYFSNPVATVSNSEEFALEPKIYNMVTSRQSFVYIRNRIYRLKNKPEIFPEFVSNLSYILCGASDRLDLNVIGNIQKDIHLLVNVNFIGKTPKELSMLGSGTLQIIEILLNSYEEKKDFNIILLDEPDSHIHRDIQKRLLEVLVNRRIQTQMFLTTHNESLIRSTSPQNIFFINDEVSNETLTTIYPITSTELEHRKTGISSSYHSKILLSLGSENSLDLLNALEADKIILVEGEDDAEYIQSILNIFQISINCVYWSFRGLDTLIKRIKYYRDFLLSIGSSQNLWDKCFMIIDADYTTLEQKLHISESFENKLQLKNYIWGSYTIESSILENIATLSYVISKKANESIDVIQRVVTSVFSQKSIELLTKLDSDEKFKVSISEQINNRYKAFKNDLGFDEIFQGNEATNYPKYDNFIRDKLNNKRLCYFADKSCVEEVLEKIYDELGYQISPKHINYFSEIISLTTKDICFDEWRNLSEKINI